MIYLIYKPSFKCDKFSRLLNFNKTYWCYLSPSTLDANQIQLIGINSVNLDIKVFTYFLKLLRLNFAPFDTTYICFCCKPIIQTINSSINLNDQEELEEYT
jgi:hypothetical protein